MFFKSERCVGVDEVDAVLDLQAQSGEVAPIEPPYDLRTIEGIGELLGEYVEQILISLLRRSGIYASILAFSDSGNELPPTLARCPHALQSCFCGQLHTLRSFNLTFFDVLWLLCHGSSPKLRGILLIRMAL